MVFDYRPDLLLYYDWQSVISGCFPRLCGVQLPLHLLKGDGWHSYRRLLRPLSFVVDVAGKRREEGAE